MSRSMKNEPARKTAASTQTTIAAITEYANATNAAGDREDERHDLRHPLVAELVRRLAGRGHGVRRRCRRGSERQLLRERRDRGVVHPHAAVSDALAQDRGVVVAMDADLGVATRRTGRVCRSGSRGRTRTARRPCWGQEPAATPGGSTCRWEWAWVCRHREAADRWHPSATGPVYVTASALVTVIVCAPSIDLDVEHVGDDGHVGCVDPTGAAVRANRATAPPPSRGRIAA